MDTTIAIPGDENLFSLYIPEEITFKTADPKISMEQKKGSVIFHISSAKPKNIGRATKSLHMIENVYRKIIAL
jgi:hypothetical protein